MNRAELMEIIRNGESSGVEFKRDDVHPQSLAKEIASLANLEGGYILLGVEDDGTVTGLTRSNIEEWVMNICSDDIQPPIIPYLEIVLWEGDKKIGVITIPEDSPDKPYKARQGSRWVTFVRIGSTSREATREQEQRLYQASGVLRYDIKPAPGSSLKDLDMNRLINYFRDMRGQHCPEQPKKQETKYLFSISIDIKNDLEANNISDDLRKAFEDNNYPLSDNVKTSIVSSAEWKISDGRKKYTIKESDNQLNIYETKKLEQEETEQWETLLVNTEIMVESRGKAIPTVGGILLFGKNPNRYLPQAGISVVAYPGMEKDYEAVI